jgi:glyoxylase-like metal-dependent hydrolase (beta-lactamase superfamily II)
MCVVLTHLDPDRVLTLEPMFDREPQARLASLAAPPASGLPADGGRQPRAAYPADAEEDDVPGDTTLVESLNVIGRHAAQA